jgi:hypothetical protein
MIEDEDEDQDEKNEKKGAQPDLLSPTRRHLPWRQHRPPVKSFTPRVF